MSIEQINTAAFDYDMMLAFIEGTVIGKAEITLSEYDSTAAPVVKVGSKFEVNGALFKVLTADETPTGYAGISSSTTFYLMYDTSGEAFVYTEVAPTWNDALQGWYGTGGEANDRYFFSMFKDSGDTLYENKQLLKKQGELYTKILELGDWNMDTTDGLNITGIAEFKNIRSYSVIIRNDEDTIYYPMDYIHVDGLLQGGYRSFSADLLQLYRRVGGLFDNADFNSTSYNRGWITIWYEV